MCVPGRLDVEDVGLSTAAVFFCDTRGPTVAVAWKDVLKKKGLFTFSETMREHAYLLSLSHLKRSRRPPGFGVFQPSPSFRVQGQKVGEVQSPPLTETHASTKSPCT